MEYVIPKLQYSKQTVQSLSKVPFSESSIFRTLYPDGLMFRDFGFCSLFINWNGCAVVGDAGFNRGVGIQIK